MHWTPLSAKKKPFLVGELWLIGIMDATLHLHQAMLLHNLKCFVTFMIK